MAKKIKSVSESGEKYSGRYSSTLRQFHSSLRPQKVCKAWHTLNIGLEGMVAEEKYNKKFGAIQDYHLTWLGWHFRGGKKIHDRNNPPEHDKKPKTSGERILSPHDWRTCDVDDCPECQDGQIISCDNCYAPGQSDAQGSWIEQEDGRIFCINCDTEKNKGGD